MKQERGRWVGKVPPPEYVLVSAVSVYDGAGRLVEVVEAAEWRRRHPVAERDAEHERLWAGRGKR